MVWKELSFLSVDYKQLLKECQIEYLLKCKSLLRIIIKNFVNDLNSVEEMIKNPSINLYSPLSHAPKYTIFREILLIADHNAYHVGQLVLLKKYWISLKK